MESPMHDMERGVADEHSHHDAMHEPHHDHNTMHEPMSYRGTTCRCGHHLVLPILVILFGVDFFLAAIGVFTWSFVYVTWPILVMIAGFMKLFGRYCRCCVK